jgi:hypothetical protein
MVFRDFTEKDIDACVKLLQTGHDSGFCRERFEWLHLQNPHAPSRIALALDNDRLVGFYAVIKKTMQINGKAYIGGRDIDPVVHPDFRRKGMFSRLLDYGLKNFTEIDVLFNFANSLSEPGFLKHGWRSLGNLQDYIFQTDIKGRGTKQVIASALSWGRLAIVSRNPVGNTIEEICPSSFGRYDWLFDATPHAPIQVTREPDYLDWRYLKKPGRPYRFFAEKNQGTITRIYILKFEEADAEITLCDVAQTVEAGSSFAALFHELRGLSQGYKIKIWGSFHRGCRWQFVRNPLNTQPGMNVLVRQMPGRGLQPDLFHIQNWLFTHGDLEVI